MGSLRGTILDMELNELLRRTVRSRHGARPRGRRRARCRRPRRPRPQTDANPIGWLVWHLTRVQDHHIADILDSRAGVGHRRLADGGSESPPIPTTPATATRGTTCSSIRPESAEALIEYYEAVASRTRELLVAPRRPGSRPHRRQALGSARDARRAPGQHRRRRHPTRRPGQLRPRHPRPPLKTPRECLATTRGGAKHSVARGQTSSKSGSSITSWSAATGPVQGAEDLRAFDVDVRQQPVEPAGQPPVGVAEQLHRRRHQHHADDGGVDQHGDGQAEAEHLDHDVRRQHERQRRRRS